MLKETTRAAYSNSGVGGSNSVRMNWVRTFFLGFTGLAAAFIRGAGALPYLKRDCKALQRVPSSVKFLRYRRLHPPVCCDFFMWGGCGARCQYKKAGILLFRAICLPWFAYLRDLAILSSHGFAGSCWLSAPLSLAETDLKPEGADYFSPLMAAWAAARRAIGTRKGEQDT